MVRVRSVALLMLVGVASGCAGAAASSGDGAGATPVRSALADGVARGVTPGAGALPTTFSECHVQGAIRCWRSPDTFPDTERAVRASLAAVSRQTPVETWHFTPTSTLPGAASRARVKVDGHVVQVEVDECVQGRYPRGTTTGQQLVIVSVDPA